LKVLAAIIYDVKSEGLKGKLAKKGVNYAMWPKWGFEIFDGSTSNAFSWKRMISGEKSKKYKLGKLC